MLYPINKDGFVVNEASLEKIQEEYKLPLKGIQELCVSSLNKNLRSIFVRGSVSIGTAITGISDLDIVVIIHKDITSIKRREILSSSLKIRDVFPFITLIDITIITLGNLLVLKEYKNLPIYLKTQSCNVYGENILNLIPPVKPGRDLALSMYCDLEQEFSSLRSIFAGTNMEREYLDQKQPLKFWCVWTMRTLLRSGLGLVMTERPLYSQDLRTCLKVFVEKYPDYQQGMEKALEYALNPVENREEVLLFFDTFISKYIKLWKPILVK